MSDDNKQADEISPPRHTSVVLVDDGSRLLISYYKPMWVLAIPVGVFGIFWFRILVDIYADLAEDLSVLALFGTTVFTGFGLFLLFLVLAALFTKQWLVLSPDGLLYQMRLFIPLTTKSVPITQIHNFSLSRELKRSKNRTYYTHSLEAHISGIDFKMLAGLREDEIRWISAELNRRLDTLKSEPSELAENSLSLPSDTRWQVSELDDGILLWTTIERRWGAVLTYFSINFFWNGLIGMLLWKSIFHPDQINANFDHTNPVKLALFFTPFLILGSIMLVYLIAEVTAPRQYWSHLLSSQSIRSVVSILGIKMTEQFEITEPLQDLQVKNIYPDTVNWQGVRKKFPWWKRRLFFVFRKPPGRYGVQFLVNDQVQFTAETFSDGEAEWLISQIKERRPEWFIHIDHESG